MKELHSISSSSTWHILKAIFNNLVFTVTIVQWIVDSIQYGDTIVSYNSVQFFGQCTIYFEQCTLYNSLW